MFEQDKTILGQKAQFDLSIDSKEKDLNNYEIDLYVLKVYKDNNLLFITEEDFDRFLSSFAKEINDTIYGKLVRIEKEMINYIIKNNSNIVIEYVNDK